MEVIKLVGDDWEAVVTTDTPFLFMVRDLFYEGDWEALEADLGKNPVIERELNTCRTIEAKISEFGEEIYEPVSFPELVNWLKDVELKISDFQHVSLNSFYDLALDYADKGLYETAFDIVEFMLEIDPNYAPAYELKGSLFLELGRVEEGLLFLDKAVEIDPWLIEAYSSLGEGYYNLGDYEKASYYWEKEIEKAPENKLTYFMLADAYEKAGEIQKAIDTLERLLHRDPKSILAMYELSQLYKKIGNSEKTKEYIEKIASMEPHYSSDIEVWAKVLLYKGEIEKVAKKLEEFLKKTKLNTHIKMLLVVPYVKMGEIQKAKELLEELKNNNVWYYYGKKEIYNEFLTEEERKICGISSD